ncbi:MAG: glycosyltransferase, partial [bacterium]
MKICLLGNARSIHCVRWANAFRQLGHDVWLISLSPPAIHPLDPGVQIEILPFKAPFGYYLSSVKAKSIINKINPDILNTH